MKRPTLLSLLFLGVFVAFFLWYTPLGGPLDADEIDRYVGLMADGGLDSDGLARLRRFLEEDTGGDFVMMNVIELQEPPLRIEGIEGIEPGDSASDLLAKYMEYMWPALFRRASHPVLFGTAAADAMDLWGVENGRAWSQGAGMRYRSRRDMMEIATNPAFQGRHDFKTAAMAKTIAFPIDPWFHLGDPRLLGGLFLVILLLLLRLLSIRGRDTSPIKETH